MFQIKKKSCSIYVQSSLFLNVSACPVNGGVRCQVCVHVCSRISLGLNSKIYTREQMSLALESIVTETAIHSLHSTNLTWWHTVSSAAQKPVAFQC